jgi:GNAT superfamily N-acetyltransferase
VLPEKRGKGLALVDEYEKWAKEKGCAAVTLGLPESSLSESLAKVYRRKGYALAESAWLKKL